MTCKDAQNIAERFVNCNSDKITIEELKQALVVLANFYEDNSYSSNDDIPKTPSELVGRDTLHNVICIEANLMDCEEAGRIEKLVKLWIIRKLHEANRGYYGVNEFIMNFEEKELQIDDENDKVEI